MKLLRGPAAPPAAPSTSDAWILASLLTRGATPLAELVARADFLNHAIPTVAELRAGLRYLHARGLLVCRARTVGLTKLGRAIQANGFARRGGGFAIVENMEKALRSPQFGSSAAVGRLNLAFASKKALDRAYAAYAAMAAR